MKPCDGRFHLYTGNNLKILPTLESESVDAVVTDPPYDVSLNPDTCPWDVWPGPAVWRELARVVKKDGLLAFTMAPHVAHDRLPDVTAAGWQVLEVGFWVWGNGRPVNPHRLKRCFDLVYFMGRESRRLCIDQARGQYPSSTVTGRRGTLQAEHGLGAQYRLTGKRVYEYGARDYHPANVACVDGCTEFEPTDYAKIFAVKRMLRVGHAAEGHPTEKPHDLVAQIVNLVSEPGQIVLDPYAGSGSMLLAAVALQRRVIGIEGVPEYVQMAEKKLAAIQLELLVQAQPTI